MDTINKMEEKQTINGKGKANTFIVVGELSVPGR